MIQLGIMAMVLGITIPMALPAPRSRAVLIATRFMGLGLFGAGLAGAGYGLLA